MKRIVLFLIICMPIYGFAQAINSSKSSVQFSIKNAGLTVDGTFDEIQGTIQFDEQQLASSSFKVKIPVKSLNTGIEMRDNHLKKDDYFDLTNFEYITFESTKIVKKASAYELIGSITIKGITNVITIPFNVNKVGENWEFSGNFKLNRRDFGVGGSSWVMADIVSVNLKILTFYP